SPAVIPEGWKLVPVEPTREMMEAMPRMPALRPDGLPFRDAGWSLNAITNRERWAAAIAAVPAAPSAHPAPTAQIATVHDIVEDDDGGGSTTLIVCGVEVLTLNRTGGLDTIEDLASRINGAAPIINGPTASEPVMWQWRTKLDDDWVDYSREGFERFRAMEDCETRALCVASETAETASVATQDQRDALRELASEDMSEERALQSRSDAWFAIVDVLHELSP